MDHLHTLNDLTPKIKCNGRASVDPALIFGLDTKLFTDTSEFTQDGSHNDEVDVLLVRRGKGSTQRTPCNCETPHEHHRKNETVFHDASTIDQASLSSALSLLTKESVWRVKGFVQLRCSGVASAEYIVNWAFGRLELTKRETQGSLRLNEDILLTVMGERGEVRRPASRFAKAIGAEVQ